MQKEHICKCAIFYVLVKCVEQGANLHSLLLARRLAINSCRCLFGLMYAKIKTNISFGICFYG